MENTSETSSFELDKPFLESEEVILPVLPPPPPLPPPSMSNNNDSNAIVVESNAIDFLMENDIGTAPIEEEFLLDAEDEVAAMQKADTIAKSPKEITELNDSSKNQDEDAARDETAKNETEIEEETEKEKAERDETEKDETERDKPEKDDAEKQELENNEIEKDETERDEIEKEETENNEMENVADAKADEIGNTTGDEHISNKENSVDEDQCRVCTSKEDLVSLFKKPESQTIAEMLMTICPTVVIVPKDFMPQFICNTCLENVNIALKLKTLCETTERELRKKLSRSKNKIRRSFNYVIIDAPSESDPPSENDDAVDDVEFKVSEISASPDDSESSSDYDGGKKKRAKRTSSSGKKGRRKGAKTPADQYSKYGPKSSKQKYKRSSQVSDDMEEVDFSSDEEDVGSSSRGSKGIKRKQKSFDERFDQSYPCDECDQVFSRKLSLILHKKTHGDSRQPFDCEVCGKIFKIQGAYKTHLEKHKSGKDGHKCVRCENVYTYKSELQRHMAEVHGENNMVFKCQKCNRSFVSAARLHKHTEAQCPGTVVKMKKSEFEGFVIGKDLFKSVAPMTTTYWSDSFSD